MVGEGGCVTVDEWRRAGVGSDKGVGQTISRQRPLSTSEVKLSAKIPDRELSKQGKELKKATIAMEKEFRQEAKKKGVDPKQHAKDLLKKYNVK